MAKNEAYPFSYSQARIRHSLELEVWSCEIVLSRPKDEVVELLETTSEDNHETLQTRGDAAKKNHERKVYPQKKKIQE